jgi:hypothetical protein
MQIQTIRSIAKERGIAAGKLGKADLIRTIQRAEGNFDCFGSAINGQCDQMFCRWREDCLPAPVAAVKKAASKPKASSSAAAAKASSKTAASAPAKKKATGKATVAKAGKSVSKKTK